MKKIMIAATFFAAALNIVSCNPKVLVDPLSLAPEYVVIGGDTVKTRDDKNLQKQIGEKKHRVFGFQYPIVGDTVITYKDIKLKDPSRKANIDKIKNSIDPGLKGKPLKMVVIGKTLASGFRDGGWFNEGMITSYPNIVAKQMGIVFDLPLFDANDYNGSERKAYSNFNPTGGSVPKIKNVINNSGIGNLSEVAILKAFTKNTDCYVTPLDKYSERIANPKERNGNNTVKLYQDLKKGKKYDFFILEMDGYAPFQNTVSMFGHQQEASELTVQRLKERNWEKYPDDGFNSNEENVYNLNGPWPHQTDNLVRRLSNQNINKGILINSPDLFKYSGYHNRKYNEELLKIYNTYQLPALYMSDGDYLNQYLGYRLPIRGERNVYGTAALDSIIGKNVNINIKPGVSIKHPISTGLLIGDNSDYSKFIDSYNKNLIGYSEYLHVPIFDLNALYNKIWVGNLVSDDGIKVNGKWPEGNFFSVDGLYPTAFGQAVISNEIIKFINSHYKTDIPLVNTRDFLKL
jgi:hypothetical protein